MIAQTLVIMRKEWEDIKSTLLSYHNLLAGVWPIFILCIAFGVYEPLSKGPDWLRSPMMIYSLSVLIPFVVVGFFSPYSFVGERIRGTLEPLLATPVSDQALLFGKIGIPVLYGWGLTLANLLLGAGLINFFFTNNKLLFYPPGVLIPAVLLSLLFSLLGAIIGTYSSLYAKTLLEAQRNSVMALFIPLMLPALLIGSLVPGEWKALFVQLIAQLGTTNLLLILIALLFLIDDICMVIALTRFHRKQLMLE